MENGKLTLNSRAIQLDVRGFKELELEERANKSPKQNQITIIHLGLYRDRVASGRLARKCSLLLGPCSWRSREHSV